MAGRNSPEQDKLLRLLRERRKKAGFSQVELAGRLGRSQSSVSKYESGELRLDLMELEGLRSSEGVDIKHYLMIDAHYTWCCCGRSYLCRILDMLHMGYVDEVLFGREALKRLPSLVRQWTSLAKGRQRR